jgi:hypothetical protein
MVVMTVHVLFGTTEFWSVLMAILMALTSVD